jgi:Fe-S cluster assembly protein SufD
LAGDAARFTARGLNLAMGRQQLDARFAVEHAASRTESRQTYRGVAGGHGRVACISRVLVGAGTQASDARQSLRSLLLSPGAEADAKPELEIRSDDVAASHGATVGQLDRDALFYLLSRGIDRTTARALLVFAFADEVLDGLPAAVRAHLEARLFARLPEAELIRGLA